MENGFAVRSNLESPPLGIYQEGTQAQRRCLPDEGPPGPLRSLEGALPHQSSPAPPHRPAGNHAHPRTQRRPRACTRVTGAPCPRTPCRAGTGPHGWLRLSTCPLGTLHTLCSVCPGRSTRVLSPPRTRCTPRSGQSPRPGSSRRHIGTLHHLPRRRERTCSAGPGTRCTACTARWRSPHQRTSHLRTKAQKGKHQPQNLVPWKVFGSLEYRAGVPPCPAPARAITVSQPRFLTDLHSLFCSPSASACGSWCGSLLGRKPGSPLQKSLRAPEVPALQVASWASLRVPSPVPSSQHD